MSKKTFLVQGLTITIEQVKEADYISLTDIAKRGNENKPADTITNWLRNQNTLLYLETWERVHNPDFKVVQMHDFRLKAADNRAAISPKSYLESTGAIGLKSKSGQFGGIPTGSGPIATLLLNFVRGFRRFSKSIFSKNFVAI